MSRLRVPRRLPAVPRSRPGDAEARESLLEKLGHASDAARHRLSVIEQAGSVESREELEAHTEFLRQTWPTGHPSGDGHEHFDAEIGIREQRLRTQARLDVLDRVAWAVLRLGVGLATACFAFERWLG
jgi:hypothetical protein